MPFLQHITSGFSGGFYTGGAVADDVPGLWDVSIGGRGYMIDQNLNSRWGQRGIELMRQQADQSVSPSGRSLNPEGLWRTGVDSWHRGAGQTYLDRDESDPFRFRSSKGVDPWTKFQLSLLNATDRKKTSSETNVQVVVAGSRLYCVDGQTLTYATEVASDSPTFTTVTGVPAAAITSICTDGYYVWIANGADIYQTNTGSGAVGGAAWSADNATLVRFAKGRLFGVVGNTLNTYDASATATAVVVAWTVPNAFTWVDVVGSPSTGHIYAAGFVGDKSLIFRIGVDDDGTLGTAIVAAELPDGEVVRSLGAYLGFVLIGTDKGVRFAQPGGAGDLELGALLDTGVACRCFEGQGPFVWFGWDDYDVTSTGLGRLSLEQFAITDRLAPAFASDLMATASGDVLSVVTFGDVFVFTVAGSGVWAQDAPLVASGTIESGRITSGLVDAKTAMFVDVRHRQFTGGTHEVALSVDGGTFSSLGSLSNDGTLPASESRGREFELRSTLSRDSDPTTNGPVVSSWTMRYLPAPSRQRVWTIPVLLADMVKARNDAVQALNVDEHLEFLRGYYQDQSLLRLKHHHEQASVVMDDFEWLPHHDSRHAVQGTFVAILKEVT